MPFYDLPIEQLRQYKPDRDEPEQFDTFWKATLAEAEGFPLQPEFERVDVGLSTVESFDVTFRGYGGQPIKGWLLLPRERSGALPCVVEYIGYGGGRGTPTDWLIWSSVGFAHLVMDSRGQGSSWRSGDTPDQEKSGNPQHPGFMTRGVLDPNTYYYRRLIVDAVRAVDAARSNDAVDPDRIALSGPSQGGGLTLAVTGLQENIQYALPDVPFLCDMRRATQLVETLPYAEIARFCKVHRDKVEQVFTTLAYFDGVNFARRAKAEALFSVALMDEICPPSTVFAAYNHYAGPKRISVYEYNGHEGGESYQTTEKIAFLTERWR